MVQTRVAAVSGSACFQDVPPRCSPALPWQGRASTPTCDSPPSPSRPRRPPRRPGPRSLPRCQLLWEGNRKGCSWNPQLGLHVAAHTTCISPMCATNCTHSAAARTLGRRAAAEAEVVVAPACTCRGGQAAGGLDFSTLICRLISRGFTQLPRCSRHVHKHTQPLQCAEQHSPTSPRSSSSIAAAAAAAAPPAAPLARSESAGQGPNKFGWLIGNGTQQGRQPTAGRAGASRHSS